MKNRSPKVYLLTILIGVSASGAWRSASAQTPFTSADALNITSFSVHGISDDGRYLAGMISERRERLNVDHRRYGDPTYITPRPGRAVVLDTETRELHPLLKEKVECRSLTFSPDGTRLALFLLEDGAYRLYIYEMDGKKAHKLTLNTVKEIASNSPLDWTPDGSGIIIALRDEHWAEASRRMFLEATEGPITVYDSRKPFLKWDEIRNMSSLQIMALVDVKSRTVTELLPEGRYSELRIAGGRPHFSFVRSFPIKTSYERSGGSEYELLLLAFGQDTSQAKVVMKRTDKRMSLSWNEDNTMFAWSDSGHIFVQSVDEDTPRNMTEQRAADDTSKVRFSMNRWSPDGRQLLATSKKGYWLIDLDSGEAELVYTLPEDDDAPARSISAWSPDGRYLYMTYAEKDRWRRGFTRLDLGNRQMEELIVDSNLYSAWRMSKEGSRFFYNFSNGDLPEDLYMVDSDFSETVRLTDLNPWISAKKLTRSELIRYLDADGEELYGILYYPVDYQAGRRYPLVCEIYETFFDNGFNESMNIIANAGFFGFRPSVTLNTGYPGEAWIKGVTSGINKLIDLGLVDAKKLGVHGTSYGGYATSLLITQTDRFAAAINISGKTNIISFLGDSPRIGTRNYAAAENGQDRIGATLWEQPMKYINHSAVLFADRVKTPHLILTGEGDWNVPSASSREMYYALRRLGKECVWVNYVHGGHGAGRASDEADYHDQWRRIIDWYQTHFDKVDEKKGESK